MLPEKIEDVDTLEFAWDKLKTKGSEILSDMKLNKKTKVDG
jgi:hypothetical protein